MREQEFLNYLVDTKCITSLHSLQIKNATQTTPIMASLLSGSIIDAGSVAEALARFLGLSTVGTLSSYSLDDALYSMDTKVIDLYGIAPVNYRGDTSSKMLLVTNPLSDECDSYIESHSSLRGYTKVICTRDFLKSFIQMHKEFIKGLAEGTLTISTRDEALLTLRKIISTAHESRASDIRIYPLKDMGEVVLSIDGDLFQMMQLSKDLYTRLCKTLVTSDFVKIEGFNESIPRVGIVRLTVNNIDYELRLNLLPTLNGLDINMRFLFDENYKLDSLGLSPMHLKTISGLTEKRNGLVLIVGPVGSGKSTTLYSVLETQRLIKTICTIEHPVEHKMPGIAQLNVSESLSFSDGIKSFLRHNCDIVAVGEIRDPDVAHDTIVAADTGHLTISTLHAPNELSTIARLRGLSISNIEIADNVIAVVSQRLIKRVCPKCGGAGCDYCNQRGTYGRLALTGILCMDDNMREGILANESMFELKQRLTPNNYLSAEAELEYFKDNQLIPLNIYESVKRTGDYLRTI